MSADAALIAHLMDVLRPLGGVASRRMFSGAGVFRDGLMFALVVGDELYIKADEATIPDFEAEGCGPFVYGTKNGERALRSYWRAPEFLVDDDDAMREWCRRAAEVAARATSKLQATSRVTRSPVGARNRRSRARRNG
ncbi:MAG: TfoX/Sxy family protein [Hyphomicrobiaceae bacterium]